MVLLTSGGVLSIEVKSIQPSTVMFVTSSVSSPLTINWTSYENPFPTELVNDTLIVGNRIQLNITSDTPAAPELEISNITIKLNETGTFHSQTTIGHNSTFSFPWLAYNYTSQIYLTAITLNGTRYTAYYENVTIINTFAPELSKVEVSGDGAVLTVTWDASDANIDDALRATILLSGDGGNTYQLIASNLNSTSYDWDSTGFITRNYKIMVRVIDSVGLKAEMESYDFWNDHINPPPTISITFQGASPVEVLEGTNDTILQWIVENSSSGTYAVLRDGVIVKQGPFLGYAANYRIENLPLGTYHFSLRISSGLFITESDPVTVIVLKDNSMAFTRITIGAAIGCTLGLVILFALKRTSRI